MIIRVPQADGTIGLTIDGERFELTVVDHCVDVDPGLATSVLDLEGAHLDGQGVNPVWEHPAGAVVVEFTADTEPELEKAKRSRARKATS